MGMQGRVSEAASYTEIFKDHPNIKLFAELVAPNCAAGSMRGASLLVITDARRHACGRAGQNAAFGLGVRSEPLLGSPPMIEAVA